MPRRVEGSTIGSLLSSRYLDGLRIHLIGIGGCGMSGAADMLIQRGAKVSGSDLAVFEAMPRLMAAGARIFIGHRVAQVDPATDLVVISAAIPVTNPERVIAEELGLPVLKYAQLLGYLMRSFDAVAVAGTHGKTTTAAMCAHVFRAAGLDPYFVVGAHCEQLGGSSGVGNGRHFVVESCEFDRSFLHFHPRSAAILNIEADHLDCFRDLEEITAAFADFARRVPAGGLVVCNGEDVRARRAATASDAAVQTFGYRPGVDWRAVGLRTDRGRFAFDAEFRGDVFLSTSLAIPGLHNVGNALAAIALGHHAGADPEAMAAAVASFRGVNRRLTFRGKGRGVTILDDYAHHPTEVRVTIEAARYRYEPRRALVVFQPHQQTRTWRLMDEFAVSFAAADEVVIPDVYGAREAGGEANGRASEELASRIVGCGGRAHYVPTLRDATDHVTQRVEEGDMVLTMGAGDVWKVADELVERFCGTDGMQRSLGATHLVSTGGSCAVSVSAA